MAMVSEVDRISSLPSEILERILFFTGMRQAVQLSILSSRWKDLWKSMPDLYFNACDFPPNGDQNLQLFRFAYAVLDLRTWRVPKLRFVIYKNIHQSIQISASYWHRFAERCRANEYSLSCLPNPPSSPISEDEQSSFICENPTIINFGMLRSLSIWWIFDRNVAFDGISHASPLLEKLSIVHCNFYSINISFTRLKVLTLHDCGVSGDEFRVAIPSLESFDYKQQFFSICELEHLPSLRHASIEIDCINQSGDAFLGVFRAIQDAASIDLCWKTLKAYYKLKGSFNCLPTFYNAKHVTFLASCQRNTILTKDLLLKWPNIETLTIR